MDIKSFFENFGAPGGAPGALPGADSGAMSRKIGNVWRTFFEKLAENPELWLSAAQDGQKKWLEIIGGLQNSAADPAVSPPKGDRRFQAEQWRQNPFFSLLMQNYLANSETFLNLAEKVDLPEKEKKILLFSMRQYVDAMSPANFPATNPEVMEKAAATGGESLAAGMRNMMEDMKSGMVANTDLSAFQVGDNLATTPGKVVLRTPLFELLEYAPQTPTVNERPLLIIPPCINKYYILDLTPEKSFVGAAVAAGHRVFLVSWANAGDDLAKMGWDDYLRDGVMAAIQAVCDIAKQGKINTLGFCIGGTLLATALAALAESGDRPAESVALLAAMLDFSDTGEIGLFVDEESVAARERQFANGGLMDGRELARGFAALRPNDLIWPYVIGNYYQGETPPAFDLLFWNADSANLPGPMFAEYLRKTYLENQISRGEAMMRDAPIDIAAIGAPVYAVACEKDHIVPWQTAYASARLAHPSARFVLAASGHIAGVINPPAKNKGWHLTANGGGARGGKKRGGAQAAAAKLPAKPEDWRNKAAKREGGWWGDYFEWLGAHAGKSVPAPKRAGNVRYPPLEDAPGTYVVAPRPPTDFQQPQGEPS